MQFKLDENLPGEIEILLRDSGHDASNVHHEGLQGESDAKIFSASQVEGRILVTLDLDFADIRRYSASTDSGIIVLRAKIQEIEHLTSLFRRLLSHLEHEALRGNLWVVDEAGIRIRSGLGNP